MAIIVKLITYRDICSFFFFQLILLSLIKLLIFFHSLSPIFINFFSVRSIIWISPILLFIIFLFHYLYCNVCNYLIWMSLYYNLWFNKVLSIWFGTGKKLIIFRNNECECFVWCFLIRLHSWCFFFQHIIESSMYRNYWFAPLSHLFLTLFYWKYFILH